MERTLARGPMVAARRGIAVLQNHQSVGRSSVSGRMWIRHFDFLWEEEEKRRAEGRWGGMAGEYLVGSAALLLLLGGEMESVVAVVMVYLGLCSSYTAIVAACVPWIWHVETNKHSGRAGRYEGLVSRAGVDQLTDGEQNNNVCLVNGSSRTSLRDCCSLCTTGSCVAFVPCIWEISEGCGIKMLLCKRKHPFLALVQSGQAACTGTRVELIAIRMGPMVELHHPTLAAS